MKYKNIPYAHQLKYLNHFAGREVLALFAEMGTGKTFMILNELVELWSTGACDAALIFCPKAVLQNWSEIESEKHIPDWGRYKSCFFTPNLKKDYKKRLDSILIKKDDSLRILVMNWDALNSKKGFLFAKSFCESALNLFIACDESDYIKNHKASRTKALMSLRKYSKFRRVMTGTPVVNSPLDLFSQFTFLDEHILGTSSFYAFKAEYCELLQDGDPLLSSIQRRANVRGVPQIVSKDKDGKPIYKNLDRLSKLIEPYIYRVLKKDCLDLPDKIYKTLFFDLTKQQKKFYDLAEKQKRIVFEEEQSVMNKLVSLSKMSQITSGYYLFPDQIDPIRIEGENPKLNLLIENVKKIIECGEKIIIWARYRIEIEDIQTAMRTLGLKTVSYHGGVDEKRRQEAVESFESGDAQIFIGNPQAGGVGITLVAASTVIYFSNSFSLRDRLQSEDRAHRIGQKKSVTYIDLVGRDTIDEKITTALQDKKDISKTLIDKI